MPFGSCRSDVFSFGVVLWELCTLQKPWEGMNPMQVVGAVGYQGARLSIPDYIDSTIAAMIQACWSRYCEKGAQSCNALVSERAAHCAPHKILYANTWLVCVGNAHLCLCRIPESRPSFPELVQELKKFNGYAGAPSPR